MPYTPLELANAFVQAGELDDARAALTTHLEAAPEEDDARRLRASVLWRLGDAQAALDDLAHLARLTPDDYHLKLNAVAKAHDDAAARDTGEAALAAYPGDERLAEHVVHLLIAAGDDAQAAAVVATMPRSWRWLETGGRLAALRGDYAEAVRLFDAALLDLEAKMNPAQPLAAQLRAQLEAARAAAQNRITP
jgi:tetratricopeptide (TPR) repeat protein